MNKPLKRFDGYAMTTKNGRIISGTICRNVKELSKLWCNLPVYWTHQAKGNPKIVRVTVELIDERRGTI